MIAGENGLVRYARFRAERVAWFRYLGAAGRYAIGAIRFHGDRTEPLGRAEGPAARDGLDSWRRVLERTQTGGRVGAAEVVDEQRLITGGGVGAESAELRLG